METTANTRSGVNIDVVAQEILYRTLASFRKQLSAEGLVHEMMPGLDEGRNIRHYTLTFVGHKLVFWVLEPTMDDGGGWAGCVMKRLFGADCTDEYAVRELALWINEIRRYGLSRHGPSCEWDIKADLNIGGRERRMFKGSCQGGMPCRCT